ncbi:GspH/FimT family pseudopilin [Pseudoxanthomonas sp. USHLN014]|uniref:GspH/FimT family pseudopilin n=1 Tax=Pseudoxanthomonas sp. USHLN014 TaxID=3081297 RepID=UPI00301D18FF
MGRRSQTRGFTLLELMVTVTVLGILAAIAFPSFQNSIRSSRVSTTTSQFTAAIAMARSEAIKNTLAAGVCPSANGTACGNDWSAGWLVWGDLNRNGLLDVSETVINYYAGSPAISVTVGINPLRFDARGVPVTAAGDMTIASNPCQSGKTLRSTITMTGTGQVRTQKGACP